MHQFNIEQKIICIKAILIFISLRRFFFLTLLRHWKGLLQENNFFLIFALGVFDLIRCIFFKYIIRISLLLLFLLLNISRLISIPFFCKRVSTLDNSEILDWIIDKTKLHLFKAFSYKSSKEFSLADFTIFGKSNIKYISYICFYFYINIIIFLLF